MNRSTHTKAGQAVAASISVVIITGILILAGWGLLTVARTFTVKSCPPAKPYVWNEMDANGHATETCQAVPMP